jgi:hypothetical protein
MQLSQLQRVVLGIYMVVMLCLCLYVPYRYRGGSFGEYSFLWTPPSGLQIDITRLLLGMLAVTFLSAVVFVFGESLWKILVTSRIG